jgi:outer membrane cobalamin receptor
MLWLPAYKEFGPEISDVLSAGFQGHINNDISWTLDGYYKKISGMVDFKPGASFIYDTSFVDMLDRVKGKAYGLEAGVIKKKGKLTGSVSYTYSRSKREWGSPEGLIWIPSGADRPHNFNLSLKYYFKAATSFGLTWVYQSGAPATIYMHETSYGEFFETKNNIRYFDYHRLDLSVRHIIYKRRFSIFLDADIYNAYNHKNTFYFKETFDEKEQRYYFKNISLFPIMPSLTVTIKF